MYSAILSLNAEGVQSLNAGEATNLVANDAQKLLELTQQIHLLWAAPIQIAAVSALLIWVLGPATLKASCASSNASFVALSCGASPASLDAQEGQGTL